MLAPWFTSFFMLSFSRYLIDCQLQEKRAAESQWKETGYSDDSFTVSIMNKTLNVTQ